MQDKDVGEGLTQGDGGIAPIHPEPRMDSAGMELMALSFALEKHPDLAPHAERVREIGSWISMGRMTDTEFSLIRVVGAMVGTIRRRNVEFHDDLPMEPQIVSFLEHLPDPLPGQEGYVDQDTLPPTERRDTFAADVAMSDVRRWTAHDQVPRALARICTVSPCSGGMGEVTMVFAEGDLVDRIAEGETRTLVLRSLGGALRVQE